MKKASAILAITALVLFSDLAGYDSTENISGVIIFESGETLEFHNFLYFNARFRENPPTNEAIPVKYDDGIKLIPFTQLKSFKVIEFKIVSVTKESGPPTKIWTGTAEIETTDGNKVTCTYDSLGRVDVEIWDEETKSTKTQSIFVLDFKNKKLNIKEIQFNN